MSEKITIGNLAKNPGCLAEYDPNAMEYKDALKWIRQFIEPVKETQKIPIRDSLSNVLSEDIYSPIDVPNYYQKIYILLLMFLIMIILQWMDLHFIRHKKIHL